MVQYFASACMADLISLQSEVVYQVICHAAKGQNSDVGWESIFINRNKDCSLKFWSFIQYASKIFCCHEHLIFYSSSFPLLLGSKCGTMFVCSTLYTFLCQWWSCFVLIVSFYFQTAFYFIFWTIQNVLTFLQGLRP